jgi:hypothetical protein
VGPPVAGSKFQRPVTAFAHVDSLSAETNGAKLSRLTEGPPAMRQGICV